jgi:hypothetical protein
MKEKETTEYLEKLKNIGLKPEVKARMRDELGAFADFHVVPHAGAHVRMATEARSIDVQRQSVFTLFNYSQLRLMKATLLIALIVGLGSTSFAAQNSIPGDLLYPIKTNVNENVRAALAIGADSEARLQADILKERLEETQKLAARGELKGEVAADVNVALTSQLERTLAASAQANAITESEVRTNINDALASFTADLGSTGTVDTNFLADLSTNLNTYVASILDGSANIAADADSAVAMKMGIEMAGEIDIDAMVAQAKERLTALQGTIEAAAEMNANAKADFEAKLEDAGEFVVKAQADLKADADAKAEESANKAHEILGEIESALSLMGAVTIDQATGFIIDIDLNKKPEESIIIDSQTGLDINGGASLENDMIDTNAGAGTSGSAAGSLGL